MYIYVYIYVYMGIHTHTHTHTHLCEGRGVQSLGGAGLVSLLLVRLLRLADLHF